ncbi:MAG: hypothetical protein KF744_10115 [Taibaiella sp.]|nr:hypothetical protein [Taibaiella sp.]
MEEKGKYFGMTVNERLYVGGVIDEFYRAIAEKNYDLARKLLEKVELTDASIEPILTSNGLFPKDNESS